MEKGFAPGSIGCHELVDRIATMNFMFDEIITAHPALQEVEGWQKRADDIADSLHQFYQDIAAMHLAESGSNAGCDNCGMEDRANGSIYCDDCGKNEEEN